MNTEKRSAETGQTETSDGSSADKSLVRIRLYIAKSTPNSNRAEQNISAALKMSDDGGKAFDLQVIDVFAHPKRAISDGVMVTPTLVGIKANGRCTMVGDLSDSAKLNLLLKGLRDATVA